MLRCDAYVCVTETQIPFWGCMFQESKSLFKGTRRFNYAGKKVEVHLLDGHTLHTRYRITSIEQKGQLSEEGKKTTEGIFRLALHGHMTNISDDEMCIRDRNNFSSQLRRRKTTFG